MLYLAVSWLCVSVCGEIHLSKKTPTIFLRVFPRPRKTTVVVVCNSRDLISTFINLRVAIANYSLIATQTLIWFYWEVLIPNLVHMPS